jgi:2-iminobutanoate/2-iminopropanoate deaminase
MSTLRQQSIDIEGIAHGAPIPTGSRVGNVLATSAVSGRDAKTGKVAADADGQARLAFENLKLILAGGGMGLGDVVKVDVFVVDDAHRDAINKYWVECYPDPHKRPARHTVVMNLRGGLLLQLSALAVAE